MTASKLESVIVELPTEKSRAFSRQHFITSDLEKCVISFFLIILPFKEIRL